ncbi:MAG: GTPase ObgE [candidate division FCPU426 bacterium]
MSRHQFVDRVAIQVSGGRGGNGSMHFHREKFVPLGGPDGGDGGRGGSVWFVADANLKTLLDFTYRKHFAADSGQPGTGKRMAGKQAQDLVVRVPVGTVVLTPGGELVGDLRQTGQRLLAAKGGRGGRGNMHFATPTRQAPRLMEKGEPGEERELVLELKLLADVGLVGLPNAGKSTLLAAVSAARPKIADYPFTTLSPNLGQVRLGEEEHFVMVDIPGLIEGASQGAGLGHEFLRHVERTRLLLHLVDVGYPGVKPWEDFATINQELKAYNPRLSKRRQVVVLTKTDLVIDPKAVAAWKKRFKEAGYDVLAISAAARQGLDELLDRVRRLLRTLKPAAGGLDVPVKIVRGLPPRFTLEPAGPRHWRLSGREVEKWVAMTDFNNREAVQKLRHIFSRLGVSAEFERQQVAPGDTIQVGKEEFVFHEDL